MDDETGISIGNSSAFLCLRGKAWSMMHASAGCLSSWESVEYDACIRRLSRCSVLRFFLLLLLLLLCTRPEKDAACNAGSDNTTPFF